MFGHLREVLEKVGLLPGHSRKFEDNRKDQNFVPLYVHYEHFYRRHIYRLVSDCFNQPISSQAGATVALMNRVSDDNQWTFRVAEGSKTVHNFGSYNYLDLNQSQGPLADNVQSVMEQYGVGVASCRLECGTLGIHVQLEQLIARFLGVQSAVTFGMGFGTNISALGAILGPGVLVISDEINHASICLGCKISGSTTKTFKHNDVSDLEAVILQALAHAPKYKKIIIIIEGVYSMEGDICPLKEIVALKKRYNCYLYLDEAHSIGALGQSGRGVAEVTGVDPRDVDILMGTFTKSFGAAGGYIAGRADLIDHVRAWAYGQFYATSMAPPIVAQVAGALKTIMSAEGRQRIERLKSNTLYFRERLLRHGFRLTGGNESPVVPLLIKHPAKLTKIGRQLRAHSIAGAIVGFPAVPMTEVRARFCMSAGHTRAQLDHVVDSMVAINKTCHVAFDAK
ncbi:Serine palmitoyltransferase 3 [Halotydeus destructor]|nr:Serine palmitoyltransferase 3 [Halotydeus destructor]